MARSTATSGHRVQCISVVCVSASVYPSRHPPGQAVITSAPPYLQEFVLGSARRLSQQNLPGADIRAPRKIALTDDRGHESNQVGGILDTRNRVLQEEIFRRL